MSGGQKQRIAIAGVLALKPKVIVLDESTAMLDPQGRKEVLKCIHNLNKNHGITIVLITHNMDEAVQAGRVVVINDGTVEMDASPDKVFSNVDELKALGLDVPQVTYLAYLLRQKGLDIPNDILLVDKCVEEILKLCQ